VCTHLPQFYWTVVLLGALSGVFHTAGIQRVSRYQLFRSFARVFGLDEALVQPEEAGDRRASLPLQADSSLSVAKTASLLGVPFNSVDEGLERLRRDGGA
jgi:dTDP-4-dehydrorhamnose reductase